MRILVLSMLGLSVACAQTETPPPSPPPDQLQAPATPTPAVPVLTLAIAPLAPADLDSPYLSPRDAARHWLQATLAGIREQRDIHTAVRGFAQAFLIDRTYAAAAFDLGILAAVAGKWDDAAGAFEEVCRLDPSGLGSEAKPQLERARLLASLERTPEGKRKRRYDEALFSLLPLLPGLTPSDATTALAQLGRIDPSRWEAPALMASQANATGYGVTAKFLEIAQRNASDAAIKSHLNEALSAARREVQYATARVSAETAAERGQYSEAANFYDAAWTAVPARLVNAMDASSAFLLNDDTAHATALLLRLRGSGDPEFAKLANSMLKELESIEPASTGSPANVADFYKDRGSSEPTEISKLIPAIDRAPLGIYARPLPRMVDDSEPSVLLAALNADVSPSSQPPPLPPLASPAIAGEHPWSELKHLLDRSPAPASASIPRTLQTADLAGSAQARHIVMITSDPAGARVFPQEAANPLCEAPCSIKVAEGAYAFRLSLPGFQEQTQTIKTAGSDREINVSLAMARGSIVVETSEPASLKVNGTPTMSQSPAELSLVPGVYRIGATFGSGDRERVVTIKPGARLLLRLKP